MAGYVSTCKVCRWISTSVIILGIVPIRPKMDEKLDETMVVYVTVKFELNTAYNLPFLRCTSISIW